MAENEDVGRTDRPLRVFASSPSCHLIKTFEGTALLTTAAGAAKRREDECKSNVPGIVRLVHPTEVFRPDAGLQARASS